VLESDKEDVAVILVSFMRDWDFWRSEARKGGGLDLERLKRGKRLAFVDGMSKMFLSDVAGKESQYAQAQLERLAGHSQTIGGSTGRTPQISLPRGPIGRTNPRISTAAATATATTPAPDSASTAHLPQMTPDDFFIKSPDIQEVQHTIESAIRRLKSASPQRKTLLVVDTPSFLLASNPTLTPSILSSVILRLHTLTSHILVHVPADDALISLSTPPQPLEVNGHNLLVKTAHISSRILSCRVLDTGFARDVSGVLRVTENSTGLNLDFRNYSGTNAEETRGGELLYLVKGDGSVKMFERGAGGEV
jgi:elongator complex protein 6